jgi:heme/copper-type cytochrome/quinol oxidase subunit 2
MATGWLIFIAIILIVVVLFQVTRTLDLVGQLRGGERTTVEMTKLNAALGMIFMIAGMLGFFISFPYFSERMVDHHSSEGSILIHKMFVITLWVTGIVFFITNVLLFWFAWKYRNRPGNEAVHFAHSNKLEFIWTIVPTIVLTGLVVFGLQAWTEIMGKPGEESMTVEVTGQQFFWSCRYPGPDQKLGPRDYDLICAENPIGIVTSEWIDHRINTLTGSEKLNYKGEIQKLNDREKEVNHLLDSLNTLITKSQNTYRMPGYKVEAKKLEDELNKIPWRIENREKCLARIKSKYTPEYIVAHKEELTWGYDDPMPSEIHVPVDGEIFVKITALDVLHNFYVPYMDVKMDAVPGMPTSFKFKPLITTADKRIEMSKNPAWQVIEEGDTEPRWKKFQYEVACAELCGVGHSSMKYTLVVEQQNEFDAWISAQPSKWSQVRNDLKLENGFSSSAPKVTEPATAVDTATVKTDSAVITMNKIK